MTLVVIDSDEWYPVFIVEAQTPDDSAWATVVDIHPSTLRKIERVFREFSEVQELLSGLDDEARLKRRPSVTAGGVPTYMHVGVVASSGAI